MRRTGYRLMPPVIRLIALIGCVTDTVSDSVLGLVTLSQLNLTVTATVQPTNRKGRTVLDGVLTPQGVNTRLVFYDKR
jgi:hypothetical protein